jgi:hypothetical protein
MAFLEAIPSKKAIFKTFLIIESLDSFLSFRERKKNLHPKVNTQRMLIIGIASAGEAIILHTGFQGDTSIHEK